MKTGRKEHGRDRRSRTVTAATLLHLLGLAWPLMLLILRHVLRTGELPMHPGGNFRMLGGGFIEAMGVRAIVASILLNGLVSAFDVLAGYWLWKSERRGGILSLALAPLYMVFAVGWLLPAMMIVAPLRAALVLRGWRELGPSKNGNEVGSRRPLTAGKR